MRIVTVNFIPETRNREVVVPKVHLMFRSDPKDRIHKEGLQGEALAAFLSSQAEFE